MSVLLHATVPVPFILDSTAVHQGKTYQLHCFALKICDMSVFFLCSLLAVFMAYAWFIFWCTHRGSMEASWMVIPSLDAVGSLHNGIRAISWLFYCHCPLYLITFWIWLLPMAHIMYLCSAVICSLAGATQGRWTIMGSGLGSPFFLS